ncbi:MAG: branched-chain amino acid ABC transporter permease, partial [Oscillibacter sp.]
GPGAPVGMVIALVLGGLVAAAFAWLIGLPVLRLKSDYLAIATLGFAEIIRAFFQWDKLGPLTNGANVLNNFPYFNSVVPFYLVAGGCIAVIVLLLNSTYGRAFKAIRDDEVAAEAMGINLAKHKMMSFVVSSFFAGIGGGLLAMYQCMAQANNFKSSMTYEILLIVVIGGIGSISGSVLASFLFTACNEWWLRFLDDESLGIPLLRGGFRKVVFAAIIMIIVLFFRRGIMGDQELPAVLHKLRVKLQKRFRKGGAASE